MTQNPETTTQNPETTSQNNKTVKQMEEEEALRLKE